MAEPKPTGGPSSDSARTIDLQDVLAFLRGGALVALVAAVAAGVSAYLLAASTDPTYRASITLVASEPGSGLGGLNIVAPPPVDPAVYRTALLDGSVISDSLLRVRGQRPSERELDLFRRTVRVSVEDQQVSSVIRIAVDHGDPNFAAEIANTMAQELIDWDRERARRTLLQSVSELERAIEAIDTQLAAGVPAEQQAALLSVRAQRAEELELATAAAASAIVVSRLDTLRPASIPERAIAPRPVFSTFIAALLGLVAGYGLLLLRSALDTRVRDREEAAAVTGLPVLAEFASRGRRDHRLSGDTASRLRTNLMLATKGANTRVIVVTSATQALEKDGVAVAVAESFARSGSDTLLVDTDLRNPGATAWLDVVPSHVAPFEAYLSNPDAGQRPVSVSVAPAPGRSFDFIPSFKSARFPVDLLEASLPLQLDDWRARYETIVLDATPVVTFADTLALARLATGVILVVSRRRSAREHVREAVDRLREGEAPVLGVVLTETRPSRRRGVTEEMSVLERQSVDPYKATVAPRTQRVIEDGR